MEVTWPEARTTLQETLDETNGAVSGAAFERNGEIKALNRGRLSFHVSVTTQSISKSNQVSAPVSCSVCTVGRQQSFIDRVLTDPFADVEIYRIPIPETHSEVPCSACQKTGEVRCSECNGNGRTACDRCSGNGTEDSWERCDCRNDEGEPAENCPTCNGRGEYRVKEACWDCNGNGHTACDLCDETGVTTCYQCRGEAYRHRYDTTDYHVDRTVTADRMPDSWETDHRKFAATLTWTEDNLEVETASHNEVSLQTTPREVAFLSFTYGSDKHNAVIVTIDADREIVWDPATSYPEMSYRRKLSDIKSRILW